MKPIHAILRARRIELGLSQVELAERAGVRQATISDIERGNSDPGASTIEALMRELALEIVSRDATSAQRTA